ncbi:class I SAM-dependent methyltransferase [Beijerinckia sp. L45]|uniref:class I SAM-dependent DNA methyltransferase n=1 Tax=Beijerinckia sp. L45 TaxID=1641855 RepID=UPI00131C208A|nr:methyltransferase domain-containing protein [Beijerinckia sp. L45]
MLSPSTPLRDDYRGRDPRADGRSAYALAAADDGAWQEAAELYQQAIDLAPDWTAAWMGLGGARGALGETAAAMLAYRHALLLDPADLHGASMRLAVLDPTVVPLFASPAYVGALFDAYAPRFEAHLTQGLSYHSPADLVAAMAEVGLWHFAHAIDLGCGTGLGGVALRPSTEALTGVDLSSEMVATARKKAIYDRLAVGDICAFLGAEPVASADLVFAADVFVYVGDLAAILTETARVLRPGGTMAFSAQRCAVGIAVGTDMRFAHAISYVDAVLETCGFAPLVLRAQSGRRENDGDVPGLIAVATRL